jgi:hypothetical protein
MNWRSFKTADIPLRERQFVVGANAAGKSNLLDVFRFLRDVAKPAGGGLQKALESRGGITKVRSLTDSVRSSRTTRAIRLNASLSAIGMGNRGPRSSADIFSLSPARRHRTRSASFKPGSSPPRRECSSCRAGAEPATKRSGLQESGTPRRQGSPGRPSSVQVVRRHPNGAKSARVGRGRSCQVPAAREPAFKADVSLPTSGTARAEPGWGWPSCAKW